MLRKAEQGSEKKSDNAFEAEVTIPEHFLCPISRDIMKNPVLCTLDGVTYEESNIRAWLEKHGNSPMNRAKMESEQSIDKILFKNRNLQEAIEDFRKKSSQSAIKSNVEMKPKNSNQNQMLCLFFKNLNGDSYKVDQINPADNIEKLVQKSPAFKSMIMGNFHPAYVARFPNDFAPERLPHQVRLIFSGKQLNTDDSLEKQGIVNDGDQIYVVGRYRGD